MQGSGFIVFCNGPDRTRILKPVLYCPEEHGAMLWHEVCEDTTVCANFFCHRTELTDRCQRSQRPHRHRVCIVNDYADTGFEWIFANIFAKTKNVAKPFACSYWAQLDFFILLKKWRKSRDTVPLRKQNNFFKCTFSNSFVWRESVKCI